MKFIKPMLAKASKLPAAQQEYAYEIKWDGLRAIIYADKGRILVSSRNLNDITAQYPELQAIKGSLNHGTILDGEIVALNSSGRPSFELLQARMGLSSITNIESKMKQVPVTYIIFDIIQLNEKQLNDQPFVYRRNKLEQLGLTGPFWQTPAYTKGDGQSFLAASRQLGLEGIMAKRLDSLYIPGKRTGDWLKIKNQLRQELVVCGWVVGKGGRAGRIGAILVGYYENHCLVYAGKVGTGFTIAMLDKLTELLTPLQRSTSPFCSEIPVKEAIFVEPKLVGEFEFTEWTTNNTLRHPSFKGLREDKPANLVTRET